MSEGTPSSWDKYSRLSLDAASAATSLGFSAAKQGTKLGFSITRGVASSIAGLTGSALDNAVFGGAVGAGPMLGGAVSTLISGIETLTLAPILLGETIASTSITAAHSSLSALQAFFPGSDEASFSLASFITLVRREWSEDMQSDALPEKQYGVVEVSKALVAWAALQGMTSQWQETRWFQHLEEIRVNDTPSQDSDQNSSPRRPAHVHVMTDTMLPRRGGQIITADIGEALPSSHLKHTDSSKSPEHDRLKGRLRRFSKLVLAGYGGVSLLFFGVPLVPPAPNGEADSENADIAAAVGSSEAEATERRTSVQVQGQQNAPGSSSYSWWNVMLGRHDKDILLHYAKTHSPSSPTQETKATATAYSVNDGRMPRFWVLTDHARREVVLVIRGTMSLNELAVDLTCDPADFHVTFTEPSHAHTQDTYDDDDLDDFDEELENIPGSFPVDMSTPLLRPASPKQTRSHARKPSGSSTRSMESEVYQVHGGMLKMARVMGGRGKPVYEAVRDALKRNKGYNLIMCGHSLGAGVAALLALMWADPRTCLTHRASGLPTKRKITTYCYAPPCLVSARLAKLAERSGLIISFVYSHDIVSRLSLGSVRDLRRATAWLCEAEKEGRGEGYGGVTGKALKANAGWGKDGDQEWFIAIRKTLEANMNMAHLYPPGRVLWAIREGDLHPSHRLKPSGKAPANSLDKVRLFEVKDVEKVFSQIVFAKNMLSSHMPHQYDRVLHELL